MIDCTLPNVDDIIYTRVAACGAAWRHADYLTINPTNQPIVCAPNTHAAPESAAAGAHGVSSASMQAKPRANRRSRKDEREPV